MPAALATARYTAFVGIDIAAATFMATWSLHDAPPATPRQFDQTPAGFQALQQALLAAGAVPATTLVVLEATGSYWVALAVALHDAGFVVSVANPAMVHDYAKSLGRRSKTDRLDAQVLRRFASERQPAPWTPPPTVYHELRQRLVVRDSLLEMEQQARNQLHALAQWPV